MVRFLLLSILTIFAAYLIVVSQYAGVSFAVGVLLVIVGLFGYLASFASWLKPHI